MATELTNKFNEAVSTILINFFTNTPAYTYALPLFTGYNRFKIVYNSVGQRLWFGNTADKFELTNDYTSKFNSEIISTQCLRRNQLPSLSDWGLPSYLGFTRCPTSALSSAEVVANQETIYNTIAGVTGADVNVEGLVPRFFLYIIS